VFPCKLTVMPHGPQRHVFVLLGESSGGRWRAVEDEVHTYIFDDVNLQQMTDDAATLIDDLCAFEACALND